MLSKQDKIKAKFSLGVKLWEFYQNEKQKLNMQKFGKIINESTFKTRLTKLKEDYEADMNAIMDKDLAGAVADLKSKVGSPEFKNDAAAGTKDGEPKDEVVPFSSANPKCTDMKPTQAEIGFSNSLDDLVFDKYNQIDNAFKSPAVMASPDGAIPVLCASIGGTIYILDGHHRWSLCFMINPDATMLCDVMQAPSGMDAEDALKVMQLAIGAKAGKIVTKPFEGQDLMSTSTDAVIKYVQENIVNSSNKKFFKYKPDIFKGSGVNSKRDLDTPKARAAVAKYIGESHKKIIGMKGPFPRTIMPQAGKSGVSQTDVNKALQAGDINYKEPFKTQESTVTKLQKQMINLKENHKREKAILIGESALKKSKKK